MEKINYSCTLQVKAGPSIPIAGTLDVDGYEKLDITVPAAVGNTAGSADVAVAPGALSAVKLLIITASTYDGSVRFQTSGGANAIALDGPVTLIGSAAVGLLGSPLDTLTLTNTAASPATVQILAGRVAVS